MEALNATYRERLNLAIVSNNFNMAVRKFKNINRAYRRGHLNDDFSEVRRPFNNRSLTRSRIVNNHGSVFAQYKKAIGDETI